MSTLVMEKIHHSGMSDGYMEPLALHLYESAHFKRRFVATELTDWNWIVNLKRVDIPTLLLEYVTLYVASSTVQLNNQKDEIIWRWTPNG